MMEALELRIAFDNSNAKAQRFVYRRSLVKKRLLFIAVLLIAFISIMYSVSIERAVFINVKPTIEMGGIEYIITEDMISKEKLGKQIGKVTKVILLVSYLEENNPYKNPNGIYKIKDRNAKDEVALEMNGKFYIARFNDNLNNKEH